MENNMTIEIYVPNSYGTQSLKETYTKEESEDRFNYLMNMVIGDRIYYGTLGYKMNSKAYYPENDTVRIVFLKL